MKIKGYFVKGEDIDLEVFKVQVSLFGQPAVLIYNEDRSYMYEETKPVNVKSIRNFIGKSTIKTYVAGNIDPEGKIHLMKVLPNKMIKDIHW